MQTITATFEDGVLKPTLPLNLPPHTEVRLTIQVLSTKSGTLDELIALLRSLPGLGEDTEDFARDVRSVREQLPSESNPWD